MKPMTVEALRKFRDERHEKSYMLIDVRQEIEYETGHIPGSILLPLDQFEEQVEELPQKDMIFYCRTGARSRAAALTADFFNEAGKEIYDLQGGMLSWNGFQVQGMPAIKIFDIDGAMDRILTDAMNLEKGAFNFYSQVLERYPDVGLDKVLTDVRDGELGHAKLIHSHLAKLTPDSRDFNAVYSTLKGDILEGGEVVDDLIASLEKRSGDPGIDTLDTTLDILETAVAMEYRAFDLYRVISQKTENPALEAAFYALSQAEKAHMKTLLHEFETRIGR